MLANLNLSVMLLFSTTLPYIIMKRLLAFLLMLLGIGSAAHAEVLRGRCEYVQDGDSLRLIVDGTGEKVRVRLHGVDAPEKNQEFSAQSRKKLEKLTRGKKLRIEVQEIDKYDRYVGKVYVGKTYVNLEMVKAGLAWYYSYHADKTADADLAAAEAAARKARRGLWSDDSVMNPRDHRRIHGTVHDPK